MDRRLLESLHEILRQAISDRINDTEVTYDFVGLVIVALLTKAASVAVWLELPEAEWVELVRNIHATAVREHAQNPDAPSYKKRKGGKP